MFFKLLYLFILICVLSQENLYVSGSFLGDLLRVSGNAKYQLADVSDNVIDSIRDVLQPPVDIYGREGPGGRIDGNMGYNIGVPPANPYPFNFYRPFAPSGSVGGQVGLETSLSSAPGALLTPETERRMRISNVPQGSPLVFRYVKK